MADTLVFRATNSIKWTILPLLVATLMTACTSLTPSSPEGTPTQTSWNNRESALTRLTRWQLNGKIAVQTAQDSGSATIDWTQNQQQFQISLMGPLGSNGLKLSGHPGNVTMQTADGKQISAKNAEQLLAEQWGWRLPVSHLKYWVRGLPVPGIPANSQFDSYHRLSQLTQQGAHIQFLSYTRIGGLELPQRIAISSPTIQAKIVVYEWRAN